MKVLFLPVYIKTPHFETELELMFNHVNSGDDVFVLKCDKNLFSCENNPYHIKSICYECISKFKNGTSWVKKINTLSYPEIEIQYNLLKNDFENAEELKGYSIEGNNIGIGVASSLISRLNRDHEFDTFKYADEIRITLKTSYYLLNVMKKISEELKPDLVYIFNGRFATTLPILLYCEHNNIPFYTHERGGKLEKYCLFKKTIPHSVNYAIAEIEEIWNSGGEDKEQIGASFYIERRNRITQGWFSFTTAQKENLLPDNFPKNKTIMSIFNSTIEEYAAIRGIENTFRIFRDEYDCLKSIFEYFEDDESLYFFLRIHPNLKGSDNTQIKQLNSFISKYNNVSIISPESKVDTYALIDNSDKVIVLGSTIGVEACYWGKPAIALRDAVYRNLDCCYWPKSSEELYQFIKNDLAPKEKIGALKNGYWQISRGIEFVYYKPETLFSGRFLNNYLKMNVIQNVFYYFYKISEVESLTELIKAAKRKLI